MVFQLSRARTEVIEKLTERDWTPTALAAELGKSRAAVYNHLHELAESGVVTKTSVAAKTRPRTEYSIGDGFVEYVAVLPGSFSHRRLRLDERKTERFRIWSLPQEEFHGYLEDVWATLTAEPAVAAIGVYGSVARGDADEGSDIDLLVLVDDDDAKDRIGRDGTRMLEGSEGTKLCMTEVYTTTEYRDSIEHGSDFLAEIRPELHPIHDPDHVLSEPGAETAESEREEAHPE